MPKFAKVPPAEVERLKRRQPTTLDLSPYVAFLETLKSGDWGTVTLEEGESQRAIKRRLTTAAKQKGIPIRYRKSKEGKIYFEVR
ncbi:MAG: hypothetical protein HY691_19570 [Chloroflexi bacterium]|nr:hypothetical protein [Chloroflexota bacterium]